MQYSVFTAVLSESERDQIIAGLATRIHPRADDVRVYPLPPTGAIETIGRAWLCEGVMVINRR